MHAAHQGRGKRWNQADWMLLASGSKVLVKEQVLRSTQQQGRTNAT